VKLIKSVGDAFCQPNIETVTISVGLPGKINNPVPASQERFQQLRVIGRFCVEGSNKRSDRGHFCNDL